jgi:hypothetical protein
MAPMELKKLVNTQVDNPGLKKGEVIGTKKSD